ncbi:Polyamine aminopropyltransferase [Galdieria sulphuraria]|uniref:thermospermine synthase n=1 Tax=Galdieria sulphuraria TaxID=130081 RepID=M2Y7V0_GALSU|nr:spermidine synthase [Galdieria sulphuraria]EME32158.1 spermidine synthase [Galdieria sulphuraria]GJD09581.1 Polyamine aminopropyltransferase [Galdieria sulphuraria]|eukprot:XP_005708678.1 spermidine synthase [Galdieria sulphuraria]
MTGALLKSSLWHTEYLNPFIVFQHGITEILLTKKTRFQDMLIVRTGAYGKALILDGKLQVAVEDEFFYHEPLVHVPAVLHGDPRSVLVLGGGDGCTVREVLKWNTVQTVLLVDIDKEVVEACEEFLPELHQGAFHDPKLKVFFEDGLKFIDNCHHKFDLIISDLTDPLEDGPSFFLFTEEFFRKVKTLLNPGGIFVTQAASVSLPEEPLHPRIVKTLSKVYASVDSIQSFIGSYGSPIGFAMASDKPIETDLTRHHIEEILFSHVKRDSLKLMDGRSFQGFVGTPLVLRRAIEMETITYSQQHLPKAFGGQHVDYAD